jgi:hypothetical protein
MAIPQSIGQQTATPTVSRGVFVLANAELAG